MIMRCATEKTYHKQADFVIIFIYLFINIISYGIQVHIIDNINTYTLYIILIIMILLWQHEERARVESRKVSCKLFRFKDTWYLG